MNTISIRWKRLAIWLMILLSACAHQTSAAPAEVAPTQIIHETTIQESLEKLGLTTEDNLCLDPENPKMRGADCMARDESGGVLLPYQSVGCTINGQQVGMASLKASVSEMRYVSCVPPLYQHAVIFIDQTAMMAAATYFGPGTNAGWNDATGFREQIWFEKDDYWILVQDLRVEVLGCYQSMEGWIPLNMPQYEANGFAPVANPELVNYRVYIRAHNFSTGEEWYTWTSGVNLTGTNPADGMVDGFRPVCETFSIQ